MVEPEDTGDLAVEEGEDLVTLLTCTPYGVNSHRLLVRGHRVPYEPAMEEEEKPLLPPGKSPHQLPAVGDPGTPGYARLYHRSVYPG